jgi:hypothetical protein
MKGSTMPGTVASYTIGFPTDWVKWQVGEGPSREDELAARAADGPEAQELVRHAVNGLDALCHLGGAFFVAALWVPERSTGVARATAQLELLTGPLDRDASWDLMWNRASAYAPQRGFTVFDRAIEVLTLPVGRAIGEVTVLAEHHRRLFGRSSRPEPVQMCVDITVFPPGSSDVVCLEPRTLESDLLDALGDAARVIAQTITVAVGPPRTP